MANITLSELLRINAEKLNLDKEVIEPIIEKSNDIEIPDELSSALGGLMDLNAAKNNPDVASKFKMQYLTTVDRQDEKRLKELGLSEDQMSSFYSEKDSLKKHEIAFQTIQDHFKSTQTTTDNGEWAAKEKDYVSQINGLQVSLSDKDKQWQAEINEVNEARKQDAFNTTTDRLLGEYTFTDAIPRADAVKLINDKVNSTGHVWKQNDEGAYMAYQKDSPELQVIEDGKHVSLKTVVEQKSASLIKKNETPEKKTTTVTTQAVSQENRWMGNAGS